MFVCVAKVTLQIPESGSLKAKRQVLRRVTDRVKARFNVSVAEVEDNELWQKATVALAVVGNERRHVQEQVDKIFHFIDEMYVAPVISRQSEVISMGDQLFTPSFSAEQQAAVGLPVERSDRSLAEAEGLGEWEDRHQEAPLPATAKPGREVSLERARKLARSLRNPRDWEKK